MAVPPGSFANHFKQCPDGEAQVNLQAYFEVEQRLRSAYKDTLQPSGRKILASFSLRSACAHDQKKARRKKEKIHHAAQHISSPPAGDQHTVFSEPAVDTSHLPTYLTSSPAKSNTLVIVTFPESFGFSDSFGFS